MIIMKMNGSFGSSKQYKKNIRFGEKANYGEIKCHVCGCIQPKNFKCTSCGAFFNN